MRFNSFSFLWNLSASWLGHALALLLGFIQMPLILHTLGDARYGFWLFLNAMAGYSGLMYLGFGDTISRYSAKHQSEAAWDKLSEVASLIFFIYFGMALLLAMIAGVVAWYSPLILQADVSAWELQLVILLLGLTFSINMVGSVFGGMLVGARRIDIERGITAAGDIVRFLLILSFLRSEFGLLTLASIYLGMTCVENLVFIFAAYAIVPQLRIRWTSIRKEVFRECVQFSSFSMLNQVAKHLIYTTDTVVVWFLLGNAAVVPYNVAQRLVQFIRVPIGHVAQICMPAAGAMSSSGLIQSLTIKSMGFTFLLSTGILIGATFFGDELIYLWVGSGYEISHTILLILLSSQVVAQPIGVLRAVLFGRGMVQLPSLIYGLEAGINLVLSLILCQWIGLVGVAWGTAIPLWVFELGLLLPLGLRLLNITLTQLFREVLVPYLFPLLALSVYSLLCHQFLTGGYSWFKLVSVTAGGGALLLALSLSILMRTWTVGREDTSSST